MKYLSLRRPDSEQFLSLHLGGIHTGVVVQVVQVNSVSIACNMIEALKKHQFQMTFDCFVIGKLPFSCSSFPIVRSSLRPIKISGAPTRKLFIVISPFISLRFTVP